MVHRVIAIEKLVSKGGKDADQHDGEHGNKLQIGK